MSAPGSHEARWSLLVAAFFAAQVLIRLAVGPALLWDESEAFFNARRLAWGYGPQPPLYFWLQWATFRVLGETLLAVALLKDALFAAAGIALVRLLAREGWGDRIGPSVLCLSLLPVLSWEAQKAYTHSILALLMAVLATAALLRCLRGGGWGAHLWLGLLLGLGTLSKLNFPLWPVALLVAAALLPGWRGGIRPVRLLASAAVASLIVAPVGAWMLANPRLAGASLDKLGLDAGSAVLARVEGTGALALAALAFWGPFGVVLGLASWLGRRPASVDAPPAARLFLAATGVVVLLIWAGLLVSGASDIRERWFLPVGWALVPATVAFAWPALRDGARRAVAGVATALWALGLLAVPAVSLVSPGHQGARYDLLARALEADGAPGLPVLVSGSAHVGNLAFAAPGLAVGFYDGEAPAGPFLLVVEARFEAERRRDPALAGRVGAREELVVPRRGEPLRFVILAVRSA